jgi:hypothetical protein
LPRSATLAKKVFTFVVCESVREEGKHCRNIKFICRLLLPAGLAEKMFEKRIIINILKVVSFCCSRL